MLMQPHIHLWESNKCIGCNKNMKKEKKTQLRTWTGTKWVKDISKKERMIKIPESKYRQLMRSRQLLVKAKVYARPLFQFLSQIKEVEEVK